MSKCDLSVVLEKEDAVFMPGDRVRGFITVDVNKSVTCTDLTVRLEIASHGRGNTWIDVKGSEQLFVGDWSPGEQQLYPFDFEMPAGPISYNGKYLNVSWYIRANVAIPWAFDPKTEKEILVKPGGTEPLLVGPAPIRALPMVAADAQAKIGTVVSLIVLAMSWGIPILIALMVGDEGVWIVVPIFGTLGTLLASWILYQSLRNTIAQRRVGEVTFDVQMECESGDEVPVVVSLNPPQPTEVRSAAVTVRAREIVVSGSGTNRTTYTHTVFEEVIDICGKQELAGPTTFNASFHIPPDAPSSFSAPDNRLEWSAQLHLDLPMWPDWMKFVPFVVRKKR